MNWDPTRRRHELTKSLHARTTERLVELLERHVRGRDRLRHVKSKRRIAWHHGESIAAIEMELRSRGVNLGVNFGVRTPHDELMETAPTAPTQPEPDWLRDLKRRIVSVALQEIKADVFLNDQWNEAEFLRTLSVRLEHDEREAWPQFVKCVAKLPQLATSLMYFLEAEEFIRWNYGEDRQSLVFTPGYAGELYFKAVEPLAKALERTFLADSAEPAREERPTDKQKSEIMYIEAKPDVAGPARIGRVRLSKSGKTLYYGARIFQSAKGGYKYNYLDARTGEKFWISRCRKDGQDTLYPGIVEIDDEVREEYWRTIRRLPDRRQQKSFRSNGKYRH